jgi:SSS family solute:Na+ symporter
MLGIAITGLLAAFMAGVAANVTAFNTVVSYDLWQAYVRKDEPDEYYIRFGRIATVLGIVVAIGTAFTRRPRCRSAPRPARAAHAPVWAG